MAVLKRVLPDNKGVRYDVVIEKGYDPKTGRRKQGKKTFRTKKEAEAFERTQITAKETGTYVEPSKLALGAYLTNWLEGSAKLHVRPTTWASYESVTRVHIVPSLGHIPLQKVTADDIERLLATMRDGQRHDGKKGKLSPTTIRYAYVVLHGALKQAKAKKLVPQNVADDVTPPKAANPEKQVWTQDQCMRFLDVANGATYHPIWHLALATGARKAELIGLRWANVDLDKGTIKIIEQRPHVRGKQVPGKPKSDKGTRTIKLDADTVAVLRAHRIAQNERKLALSTIRKGFWK